MNIKHGIAVSPGVAMGPAFVLDAERFRIPEKIIKKGSYPDEIERLRIALGATSADARQREKLVRDSMGNEVGAIFMAHAMMIEDPGLRSEIESQIRDQGFSAEYAVSRVMRQRRQKLEGLSNNSYFTARAADLNDLEQQLLSHLLGKRQEPLRNLSQPVVLLAHDLTPSETAVLSRQTILGFATEVGGKTSHTAIMAGMLEIPAVVGLGKFLDDVSGGDEVIIDGSKGDVVFDPDDAARERYEHAHRVFVRFEQGLSRLRDLPAVTRDGLEIQLLGNIEFPEEIATCLEKGACGVGLYRTEFLYLGKKQDPTEEEHFEAYRKVVTQMAPRPVTIRTLDLGADKFSSVLDPNFTERNPFLGVRSVRICLRNTRLFTTQLRAILRASAYGAVRIMFPMISSLAELRQCKLLLGDVMDDLRDEGVPFNAKVPIGTMVEVPSAAIMADAFARGVDFLSIGTNDLIQYTLAADRTNENVAEIYNAGDPAVLWLIDRVVKAAETAKARGHAVEVSVCGEMSGDPLFTILLVGMGVRQFSATPHHLPEIKQLVRLITAEEAMKVARDVLQMVSTTEVNNYLREYTRRVLPEVVVD
ncbi:MAG TPA: phosphoenolpyruvate--protein phosphotransferase [Gemmatales bacterium]|nr:phosphoenolpyruvate--protein phosphotransferase [Gemmatales bacterium]